MACTWSCAAADLARLYEDYEFASRLLGRGYYDLAQIAYRRVISGEPPAGLKTRAEVDLLMARMKEMVESDRPDRTELERIVKNFDECIVRSHAGHTELDISGVAPDEADAYFMAERSAYSGAAWARYYLGKLGGPDRAKLLREAIFLFGEMENADEPAYPTIGKALCHQALGETTISLDLLDGVIAKAKLKDLKLSAGVARAQVFLEACMYDELQGFVRKFFAADPGLWKFRKAGDLALYLAKSYASQGEECFTYHNVEKGKNCYAQAVREGLSLRENIPRMAGELAGMLVEWAQKANMDLPPDVILDSAETEYASGRYEKALDLYAKIANTKLRTRALRGMARCSYNLGRYADAETLLAQIESLTRDDMLLYISALRKRNAGEETIVRALKRYLSQFADPGEAPRLRLSLARDFLQGGRPAVALDLLDIPFSDPALAHEKLLLASRAHFQLLKAGRKEQLPAYIATLHSLLGERLEGEERASFTLALAEAYLASEPPQAAKALAVMEEIPAARRNEHDAQQLLCRAFILGGRLKEAAGTLDRLLGRPDRGREDGLLCFALAARILKEKPADLGDWKRTALKLLLSGFDLAPPPDATFYRVAADLCLESGEYEKARAFYEKAGTVKWDEAMQRRFAEACLKLNDHARAYEYLKGLKRDAADEIKLARCAWQLGKREEAEAILEKLGVATRMGSPLWAEVHYELAALYLQTGRKDRALKLIEMGLTLCPKEWLDRFQALKKKAGS